MYLSPKRRRTKPTDGKFSLCSSRGRIHSAWQWSQLRVMNIIKGKDLNVFSTRMQTNKDVIVGCLHSNITVYLCNDSILHLWSCTFRFCLVLDQLVCNLTLLYQPFSCGNVGAIVLIRQANIGGHLVRYPWSAISDWAWYQNGVCSIFLRVDRSINKIHKPRILFWLEVFYKKYVFIYCWHFLCS